MARSDAGVIPVVRVAFARGCGDVAFPARLPQGTGRAAFGAITSMVPGTPPVGTDLTGNLVYYCRDLDQPAAVSLVRDKPCRDGFAAVGVSSTREFLLGAAVCIPGSRRRAADAAGARSDLGPVGSGEPSPTGMRNSATCVLLASRHRYPGQCPAGAPDGGCGPTAARSHPMRSRIMVCACSRPHDP